MKLRATTWLSFILLALVLTVVVGQSLHQKSPSKEEVERVRKLVLGDSFAYSNGTCQWQWASWETGGPPCPIRHHMKLLPLPKNNHMVNEILNLALLNVKAYVKYVINNVFPEIPIGITVGITYGQDYIYAEGTGVMNDTNTNPPNLDTIYDVGSITKIFTSLALFQTIQNGKTSLDDKVTNYFNEQSPPVFSIRNPYSNEGANAVTFRTLAAQSAGVPTDAFCGLYPLTTDCENNTLAAQMNMEALQNIGLKYLPGTGASYSNLGLSLLGRSLERIWDKQYESYMVEDLFLPLGMNSSGFVFTDEVMDRMITGYRATQLPNGTITGTVSNYNTVELGWCAPAGGLYTTANDIHQFYKTLFQLNGSSVINASTFVAFMAPGTFLRDGISMYGAGTFESAYAANYWTLTKGGLVDGFAGSLAIVPELNLGVSVFINTNSGFWASILSALITGEIQTALDYILPRIQEPSPLPPNYQSLLGTYGHALTNMVTMSEQANNTSGVLNGTINFLGSVYFVWDPELDIPSAGVTAFRYSLTQQPNSSCFIVQGSGNNGVAYFSVIKGVQTVTIADENLSFYALPKRPHRAAAEQ